MKRKVMKMVMVVLCGVMIFSMHTQTGATNLSNDSLYEEDISPTRLSYNKAVNIILWHSNRDSFNHRLSGNDNKGSD